METGLVLCIMGTLTQFSFTTTLPSSPKFNSKLIWKQWRSSWMHHRCTSRNGTSRRTQRFRAERETTKQIHYNTLKLLTLVAVLKNILSQTFIYACFSSALTSSSPTGYWCIWVTRSWTPLWKKCLPGSNLEVFFFSESPATTGQVLAQTLTSFGSNLVFKPLW